MRLDRDAAAFLAVAIRVERGQVGRDIVHDHADRVGVVERFDFMHIVQRLQPPLDVGPRSIEGDVQHIAARRGAPEIRRGTGGDDRPFVDEQHLIAVLRLGDVLRGDHHRLAFFARGAETLPDRRRAGSGRCRRSVHRGRGSRGRASAWPRARAAAACRRRGPPPGACARPPDRRTASSWSMRRRVSHQGTP